MIKASSPCRISLFGGGTDIPTYKNGGMVLNMGINLRQELEIDDVKEIGLMNIIPGKADWKFYEAFLPENIWYDANFDGEITGGIGSSASVAVALVGALERLKGHKIDLNKIAEKAWKIETKKLGLFGGKQDQYASAYGGVNLMTFRNRVHVIQLSPSFIEPVKDSILLFHTGENRKSGKIQEGFKKLNKEQVKYLDQMRDLVMPGLRSIQEGNIKEFGRLLTESWELKKKSNSGVSNEKIDKLFEKGKRLGALGWKLLGAGGGGYCIFIVNKNQEEFKKKIGIKWVDYSISWDGLCTRII
jgi:D-glycero-alpha-D-manno-heptose-7-phosphate kinase